MVGTGIFALSADAARYAGPAAILSYFAAGVGTLVLASNLGHLAARHPAPGGPYVYVRDALGGTAAAVAGWQLWLGMALSASFYALGFAQYLRYFLPALPMQPAATVTVAALALLHAGSHRGAAALQNLSVAFLLLVLGGLVVVGLPRVERAFYVPVAPYGWRPVVETMPLVFTSYLGFDVVAQAGAMFVDPRRTIPRASVAAVATVTILYSGIMAVALGIIHHVDLGQSPIPLAEVARRLLGRPGGAVVAFGGLVATLSSANGVLVAAAELTRAMSADAALPRPVGRHARWVVAAVATAGTAVGPLEWLARGIGALHLLPLVLIPLAVLHEADGGPDGSRPASGRRRQLGRGHATLAVAGMAIMGFMLRQLGSDELRVAVAFTAPGLVLAAHGRRQRHDGRA